MNVTTYEIHPSFAASSLSQNRLPPQLIVERDVKYGGVIGSIEHDPSSRRRAGHDILFPIPGRCTYIPNRMY